VALLREERVLVLVGGHHAVLLLILAAAGLEHGGAATLEAGDRLEVLAFLGFEFLRLVGELFAALHVAELAAAFGEEVVELVEGIGEEFGRLVAIDNCVSIGILLRFVVVRSLRFEDATDFLGEVADATEQRFVFALAGGGVFAAVAGTGLQVGEL